MSIFNTLDGILFTNIGGPFSTHCWTWALVIFALFINFPMEYIFSQLQKESNSALSLFIRLSEEEILAGDIDLVRPSLLKFY